MGFSRDFHAKVFVKFPRVIEMLEWDETLFRAFSNDFPKL